MQFLGILLQVCEEIRVADEGNFNSLDIAGAFIAWQKRGEHFEIIDDRERGRESANEVFLAESVDAVLHADAGIGLAERRSWNAHVAHAAMGRRGSQTNHVEQRPAAYANHVGVAVNMVAINMGMDFGNVKV